MSSPIANLVVKLSADIAEFKSEFAQAKQEASKFHSEFEGIATKASILGTALGTAISGGAFAAANAFVSLTKSIVADASQLVDLSNKTGLSTEALQRMQYVATQSGGSLDKFTDAAFMLGTRIEQGTTQARKGAEDLGLSFEHLRTLSPDKQFDTVVAALERMEDPQRRNTDGVLLFGRTFKGIASDVADGYTQMSAGATVSSDAQIRALDRAGDAWEAFVAHQKKVAEGWLGNWVQAFQTLDTLTAEQRAEYNKLLNPNRGPGATSDAQAFLLAVSRTHGTDVNLPFTAAALPPDYLKDLATARAELTNLTKADRAEIAAAVELGAKHSDLAEKFGLSDGALRLLLKDMSAAPKASKAMATAAKETAAGIASVYKDVLDVQTKVEHLAEPFDRSLVQLRDRIDGVDLVAKAQLWIAALQETGAEARVLADADLRKELGDVISGLVGKFGTLEKAGVGALDGIADALDPFRKLPDVGLKLGVQGTIGVDVGRPDLKGALATTYDQMRAIDQLGKSLEELGRISGGTFGHMVTDIGKAVESTHDLVKGIEAIRLKAGGSNAMGFADALSTLTAIAAVGVQVGNILSPLLSLSHGKLGALLGTNHTGRDLVLSFANSLGGFDELQRRLADLGAEGARLWVQLTQGVGRANPAQAQAAIDAVTAALAEADRKQATFNTSLGGFLGRIKDLQGALPDSLRSYLADLERGGKLTQENIDLLHELAGNGEVDWHKIEAAVGRYGGNIDKLAGSFQGARMHDQWQQLIDDMDLFEKGGISATDTLELTKNKIIDLVNQSVHFGTDIPENMRPWIEKLITSGELVDENGVKITDISKLHFGATLQTSIDNLTLAVQGLIKEFENIPGVVAKLPTQITTKVVFEGEKIGSWPDETQSPQGKRGTWLEDFPAPIPQAGGGIWNITRPTLFLAGEAGPEQAIFSGANRTIAGMNGAAGPISGPTFNVVINGDVDSDARAERLVKDFSREVQRGGKSRSLALTALGID